MKRKRDIIVWAVVAAIVLGTGKTKGDFIFGEPFPVPNVNSENMESGTVIYSTSTGPGDANSPHTENLVALGKLSAGAQFV